MKSIEVANALKASFADRGACRLTRDRGVTKLRHGERHTCIVLDLDLSREILLSDCFSSCNYFQEGIEHLAARGRPAPLLNEFFNAGLLFREGSGHHTDKREHMRLLDRQCEELERMLPALTVHFDKKKRAIGNALEFAMLLVRLCVGVSVSRLTGAPLTASMRALRRRENLFHFHFHPVRHQRMEAVLQQLVQSMPEKRHRCSDNEWLLAVSLIVMGYDPLVGTLCADLTVRESPDLTRSPARYCPTSFVPRICVRETSLAGRELVPGDICYLSLVASRNEDANRPAIPFGLGVHTCAGKKYSGVLLGIADEVARRCFPDGFRNGLEPRGDGAFLVFRPPGDNS